MKKKVNFNPGLCDKTTTERNRQIHILFFDAEISPQPEGFKMCLKIIYVKNYTDVNMNHVIISTNVLAYNATKDISLFQPECSMYVYVCLKDY